MPDELLSALCEVLGEHTETSDRCWYCLWDGWGWVNGSTILVIASEGEDVPPPAQPPPEAAPAFPPEIIDGPRVSIPQRDYILFKGPLATATGFEENGPALVWPDDRAWCVATEIDLDSTYVGGSQGLVNALLGDPRFEAWPAEPDDRVDAGADEINPSPA
jgi:hypothetical protein